MPQPWLRWPAFQSTPGRTGRMGLDESYQSRRLRWDVCFDQNAARNIQNTNSGLLERDVQCNVLIHDRSPGNKPQRQTWWHASRAESGRADYPMCENNSQSRNNDRETRRGAFCAFLVEIIACRDPRGVHAGYSGRKERWRPRIYCGEVWAC